MDSWKAGVDWGSTAENPWRAEVRICKRRCNGNRSFWTALSKIEK